MDIKKNVKGSLSGVYNKLCSIRGPLAYCGAAGNIAMAGAATATLIAGTGGLLLPAVLVVVAGVSVGAAAVNINTGRQCAKQKKGPAS